MPAMTLIFEHKHFHLVHIKVLISCKKRVTILTNWTLECGVNSPRAVVSIWRVADVKITTTSKYRAAATLSVDSVFFLTIYQWHLCCRRQTTFVDKAEQECIRSSLVYPITGLPLRISISSKNAVPTLYHCNCWSLVITTRVKVGSIPTISRGFVEQDVVITQAVPRVLQPVPGYAA